MKLEYRFSEKFEVEAIHEKSLEVLENIGIIFESDEAMTIFKSHGAKVDGHHVLIPRKLVTEALKTTRSSFQWVGREKTVVIGGGQSLNVPAYGPIYTNRYGKYQSATPEDYVNFHKLHESSQIIDAGNPHVLEPTEIPSNLRDAYRMASTLKYHTKPVMGLTTGKKGSLLSIEMTRQFYDNFEDTLLVGLVNLAAPLHVAEDMTEALMIYAKNNQGLVLAAGSGMSGLTAPASIASNVMMSNAAVLGAITLSQLVNPGAPIIYGFPVFSTDLRTATPAIGGAETPLIALAGKEMATYYGLPLRALGSLTDTKAVDFQCGSESMMNMLTAKMMDTDFIIHSAGIMDSFNTYGYEKFILDEELIAVVERYLRGFEVSEKRFLYDTLEKVGCSGHFLSGKTPKMYREDYFLPKLANRESINEWRSHGEVSVLDKANAVLDERLEAFVEPKRDPRQEKIIRNHIPKGYFSL
ncbi:MAG: trimethylamine methyltransferase family protein [Eubacteriaceae bacterium]